MHPTLATLTFVQEPTPRHKTNDHARMRISTTFIRIDMVLTILHMINNDLSVHYGDIMEGYTAQKKPVTTMLTYPWKCTVLHCNHLGNTWKPLVLMTRHFDYCPSASEGDNQSVRSSAPVVSRCFPGGYNVKLYISRARLAWWLLAFLHSDTYTVLLYRTSVSNTYYCILYTYCFGYFSLLNIE